MRTLPVLHRRAAVLLTAACAACAEPPAAFEPVDRPQDPVVSPWRLTFNPGDDHTPVWAVGGDSIIYVAQGFEPGMTSPGVLVVQPKERGVALPLLTSIQHPSAPQRWLTAPAPSPDGQRLAFVELQEVILAEPCSGTWICDSADTVGSVATLLGADVRVRSLDATGPLANDPLLRLNLPARYDLWHEPGSGLMWTRLEVLPYQELFRDEDAPIFRPGWSPDGRRIVTSDGVSLRIWDVASGVSSPIPGTEDGVLAAWSPDGEWIAFVKPERTDTIRFRCTCMTGFGPIAVQDRLVYRTGRRMIAIIRPDGTGYAELVEGTEPAWLPDSRGICFQNADRLWVVSIDGGSPIEIPNTMGGREPAVSPDGRYVVFSRRAPAGDRDVWIAEMSSSVP